MDLTEEESAPLVNWDTGDCGPDVHRSRSSTAASIQVHLYFTPTTKNAATIHIRSGQRSAENVCIQAAQECGILPVYQSLFALATSDLSCWYHPAHIFHPDENIQVHFRVRFFFGNWFGQGSRTSYRYSLTRDIVSPVLDYCVLDYLFAQLRSDFVASQAGVSPPLTAQEECLGLAVLDLWRMAKERHQSVRELCKTVSYKSCLPKIHCRDIQRRNRLDRFRIRNTLKRFLKKLGSCSMDEHSLKLKYLIELASIEPSLGSETFEVHHSSLHQSKETTLLLVRVSGEAGIFTSFDSLENNQEWQRFCDFQEIIAISVKRVCHEQVPQDSRMVIVTRRDDICLEAKFPSLKEALSFVSLVDGYFRLTTDSCHYFCQEIAPPSLLEAIENHCHGPITSEFAINKLKKSGLKEGAFVLRQSPIDYNNFFLTVCVRSSLGLDYKDCLITKNEHYSLQGVSTDFFRLKELTTFYQHNKLLLADVPVKLKCCCPPSPKEFTNLIILRNGSSVETQSSPTSESNKFSHIEFHMIKYETLTWEECLGQGSFTRVFRGTRADTRDGERHVTEVLLKELDVHHKENCWELFFEAASLMSQISHKHLLHVYGVSVHGANNIMVQEFVKYGALDLYLKRHSMSVSWKLDVAKQLASALNFLEEKNIVHGNICAKNLLLAREGDAADAISPFIKLSDLGINRAMLGTDVVLDRIPWVAPELLEEPGGLTLECDKWSFGTTLWEIFNNGSAPLPSWDLDKKRQFYETFQQLVPSQWTELAELVSHCMDYQAVLRPSCRSIIRQLNSLITSDYVILQANEPLSQRDCVWRASYTALQDRTLFEERYLRYTSQLGKGNFGIVELCRYDPMGDNTGELVAVKRLQPNQRSTLQDFSQEIHTLSVLRCDYIVQYRGVCYGTGRLSVSLVMEYMPYGSLMSYLEKNAAHLDVRRLLLFASQICKGMEYLQSMRYVHRDLAARNILVGSEFLVKIADFGLTKIIPYDKEYYRVTQQGESPIFWHAPESIDDSKFSHKSDVWSFGVVLHELFSYCAKSHNPKRLYMQEIGNSIQGLSIFMHLLTILQDNWRLPTPPNCPPMVYAMMRRCWAYDAEERPLFSVLGDQIEDIIQEDI